jgi:GrpB-like predicted nucleotidyltransferase (UPF0157 family)
MKKKTKPRLLVPRSPEDVDGLTEKQAKDLLRSVLTELDACDFQDELGTEGWRHRFGLAD